VRASLAVSLDGYMADKNDGVVEWWCERADTAS
jgi:hypothetical protein